MGSIQALPGVVAELHNMHLRVVLQVLRYSLSMILALMAAGLTAARLLGPK